MEQSINQTDLHERQIELEEEGVQAGVTRYRAIVAKATEKGSETSTTAGKRLLKAVIEPTEKAIKKWLDDATSGRPGRRHQAAYALKELDPAVTAFITAKSVLDNVSKRATLAKASIGVGMCIEDELRLQKFQCENKKYFNAVASRVESKSTHYGFKRNVFTHAMKKEGIEWAAWSDRDRLLVGQVCLDAFMQATNMVEAKLLNPEKNSTIYHLVATDETMRWINDENARCELMAPMFFPMLVPPKPWTSPFEGGYYSTQMRRNLKLMKVRSKSFLEELSNREMPVVYEAVNTVQATPWKINKDVMKAVQHFWTSESRWGNLPSREDELPPACPFPKNLKKENMDDNQLRQFREWKRAANRVYDSNIENRSKRLQASKIIYLAERFSEEDAIYFPHNMDFRGRIYAIPMFLNPQGQDLAKGLLTFGEGKPLGTQTAADWLAVQGANTFGYDKASFTDRVQWVKEHESDILACANDPAESEFWSKADSPWQFLAFCYEWKGYCEQGLGFVSSLPVALDGSCNGLQHYSAMLRDPIGGSAVNLVPSDLPQDIYQRVADVAKGKLEKMLDVNDFGFNPDKAALALKWLEFGVSRKLTKRPVMCLPYGLSYYSAREYVEDHVYETVGSVKANEIFNDSVFEATKFMSTVVWESIGEVVVAARQAMDWLQKVAKVTAKEGLPINWTTPAGLPVLQPYEQMKQNLVKTKMLGSMVRLTVGESTGKVDVSSQATGIAPNFVHSLDASCLMFYVVKGKNKYGINCFGLVHDSYATLAADTENSSKCLREAFCELYDTDPLEDLLEELLPLIPEDKLDKIPAIPRKGSLNLDDVLVSKYFFS